MEKIKVNMTPIEEVKTIHASQNDNATRKWAFDLYDENGKIDSSDIKEQMIFDSRVGGTEQILPVNGSDPTTSPIIADIQYPDSLRSEQTFLYRESPTQQDGQAKITNIKGNTLVWNQLVQNGNFVDTSGWTATSGSTLPITGASNNKLNFTCTDGGAAIFRNDLNIPTNHKFLFKVTTDISTQMKLRIYDNSWVTLLQPTSLTISSFGFQYLMVDSLSGLGRIMFIIPSITDGTEHYLSNVQLFDLTAMFGSGNEPTSVDQFISLYPLPYYDYTTGKLLPFKGESLKTTGKNILKSQSVGTFSGVTLTENNGTYTLNGSSSGYQQAISSTTFMLQKGTYTLATNSNTADKAGVQLRSPDGSITYAGPVNNPATFTFDEQTEVKFRIIIYAGAYDNVQISPQLELGSSPTNFEPYTENTINLPTLNYFSSGMKSAGSVYDEITESKAITRIGSVDLGSFDWIYHSSGNMYVDSDIFNHKNNSTYGVCPIYSVDTGVVGRVADVTTDKTLAFQHNLPGRIIIRDTSYTDATTFKTAMSGVYLYYELATPTEENIPTASLVTEKGEAPLYYDDELIADCNETISSESGIFDAKIKLMDDETVYSQKIQLHVERKPQ